MLPHCRRTRGPRGLLAAARRGDGKRRKGATAAGEGFVHAARRRGDTDVGRDFSMNYCYPCPAPRLCLRALLKLL